MNEMKNGKQQMGNRLKKARQEKKLSQEDVARHLLVSRQSVSKWENNICLPDLENFKRICELYGVDAGEFLDYDKSLVMLNDHDENKMLAELEEREITVQLKEKSYKLKLGDILIPFYSLYYLKEKIYKTDHSKLTIALIFLNVIISLLFVYVVYLGFPKTTGIPSSF